MIRLRHCIAFVVLLSIGALNAQTADQYVRDMFGDNGDAIVVRSLSGMVNDLHPIRLTVGSDINEYRGLLQLEGMDQDLEVIGSIEGQELTMEEVDQFGHVTGYIKGRLEDDRFTGQWWSSDLSRSADIRLLDEGLVFLKEFEPQLLELKGMVGDESLDWMLYKESPYVVSGTWQRASECVRMIGECTDFLCDQIELTVSEGELHGSRVGLTRQGNEHKAKLSVNGRPLSGTLAIYSEYPVQRKFITDYHLLVDYTYPVIEAGDFDHWISEVLDHWMASVEESTSDAVSHNYNTRWLVSASAWVDIYLVEDQIVSGLITMYDVTKSNYSRKSFTYDLDQEREVTIEELTKKGVNLLAEIQQHIDVSRDSRDFIYPVLSETGFVVCTDFDPVEGDVVVCVPYADVASSLRKRSLFTKLAD